MLRVADYLIVERRDPPRAALEWCFGVSKIASRVDTPQGASTQQSVMTFLRIVIPLYLFD
jgi:hypothetical protein